MQLHNREHPFRPPAHDPQPAHPPAVCSTTVFSHYADKNTPAPGVKLPTLVLCNGDAPADGEAHEGPYWSLMFEVWWRRSRKKEEDGRANSPPPYPLPFPPLQVSESQYKPVDQTATTLGGTAGTWPAIVQQTIQVLCRPHDAAPRSLCSCLGRPPPFGPPALPPPQGAINTKLVKPGDEIVSIYHRRLEHGYPTPSGRQGACRGNEGRREGLVMAESFADIVTPSPPPPPHARARCSRPRRGAATGAALAAQVQHLEPRPLWQLQVRGGQPGGLSMCVCLG